MLATSRLFLGERDRRFGTSGDPTSADVLYFTFPNHLYENLWLRGVSSETESNTGASSIDPAPGQLPALDTVTRDISEFLAVVDPGLQNASICLVVGDDALVREDGQSCPRRAAWINVDHADQYVLVDRCPAAGDETTNDLVRGGAGRRTARIGPKEGILWNPQSVIVREVDVAEVNVSVKIIAVA